jgi:LmbE family N-acetylglucosaminyl deacetylase
MRPGPASLFIAPHNDDETLFGAFTLLREKPHVVVCLRSIRQELRGTGVTYSEREQETANALEILNVDSWEQWTFSDAEPTWQELERALLPWKDVKKVYAPAYERGGHEHHNKIARIATRVFPRAALTSYLTYTRSGRSSSRHLVPFEPEWVVTKLRALACYHSQIVVPETWTTEHFVGDQHEYYAQHDGSLAEPTPLLRRLLAARRRF